MKTRFCYISIFLIITLLFLNSFPPNAFGENEGHGSASDLKKGNRIYSISCVLCHGSKGQGDGPASVFIGPYSHPRPNDFTQGVFKYRSTESGDLPTFSDLTRTIRYGIPGYMPSFKHLGEDGVRQVAFYISNTFIEDELSVQPMDSLREDLVNLLTESNAATSLEPKPNLDEIARIEVYKEITAILNNIARNARTAIAQEENPEQTLNMYEQIITTLDSMIDNLESSD